MSINKALLVVICVGLFVSLVYASNRQVRLSDCLTSADVLRYAEHSRQGISLTCNEHIRQHNLQNN